MEKIDEQLNNLSLIEIPVGMHQSIMHKVNYKRIKPILFSVLGLLVLNFFIIAWHINGKLVNAEFSDMMKDFFETFDLSFYFVGTILGSFFEIVSPAIVLSLLLNLGGAIYVGKKIRASKKELVFETNRLPVAY
ncbi:MAG: hypothetical protein NT161_03700 [Candidatus Nomurabacteria bacterium]|nr:hypothetical protein [Candidatus Nomurabacteria bacterium]